MTKRKKTGGRKKGTPNKLTGTLKDMILQSLANAGGTAYLEEQAVNNPNAYLALVGRVLPLQVKEDSSEPAMPTRIVDEFHTT